MSAAFLALRAEVVGGKGELTVLLTNHALPRHPIGVEDVRVELHGIGAPARAAIARVDADHANPRRASGELGSPEYLSVVDVAALESASRVAREPIAWFEEGGAVAVDCALQPHAVAAIRLELA